MSRIVIISALLALSLSSIAQIKLLSMDSQYPLEYLHATSFGDSILLKYSEQVNGAFRRKAKVVAGNRADAFVMPADPIAMVKSDGRLYWYYLENTNRRIVLKAYASRPGTDVLDNTPLAVPVNGIILGVYQDKGLKLITYSASNRTISVTSITKDTELPAVTFSIPPQFKIGEQVDFIDPKTPMNSFKGIADNQIFVSQDKLYFTMNGKKPESSAQTGTLLLTADLTTSKVSSTSLPSQHPAATYVADDKLFQLVTSTLGFKISIFSLATLELIATDSIRSSNDWDMCYFRYGKKNIVGKNATLAKVIRESDDAVPSLYVERVGDSFALRIGTYYNKSEGSSRSTIDSSSPIASALGSEVSQYQDRPGVHRFLFYAYNTTKGIGPKSGQNALLVETINNFELQSLPRVTYKTYFPHKKGIAGLYYTEDRKYVIYYFESPIADEVRSLDADSVAKVMTVNHTKVFSTAPESELSAFHALAVGDSILLSYNWWKASARGKRVMWVKEGRATSISLPVEPIAVYEGQDSAFLYYIENIKKSDVLNAMVLKKGGNTMEDYKSAIPIDDQIVGNFTQGNLFFVTLDKTFSKLSLLELRGTKVIGRKQFKIPVIEHYVRLNGIDFYPQSSSTNSFNGFSNVKLFQYGDLLYLSIDYLSMPVTSIHDNAKTETNGTVLITMNYKTGKMTTQNFPAATNTRLGSYVLDKKLFRIGISKKSFLTSVYNIESGDLITSDSMKLRDEFKCYFRYGRDHVITLRDTFKDMVKESPATNPAIYVEKNDSGFVIQWGTYFNKNPMIVAFSPIPAGIIVSIVGNAFLLAMEKPGIHHYINYEWKGDGSFEARVPKPILLRERIDAYEIRNAPDLQYKSYINFKNGVAGIYYSGKLNQLFITSFQ